MSLYKEALSRKRPTEDKKGFTILGWIQQQIDYSDEGIIRMKLTDIQKALGRKFENKTDIDIYYGLQRSLSDYGILVRRRKHAEDDSQILTMEYKQYENDKLKTPGKIKAEMTDCKNTIWVGKYKDKTGTFEILVPAANKGQAVVKIKKSLKDIKEDKKRVIGKIEDEDLMYIEEVGDFDYIRV